MNSILNERDPQTGLSSRRAGLAILHDCIEHNSEVALLFCDVDRLRDFHEIYGPDRGVEELCRIARDLKWICGLFPIAYFGGDEFLIVLPEVSLERAREIAAEILASQPPVTISSYSPPVEALSLSIGIAHFPLHAQSDEKLLTLADIALFKAKSSGRSPDGSPYKGRNRAMAWGDFVDDSANQAPNS